MQRTMFYMSLQVSKEFELEKEFLTIDNYCDSIIYLMKDYLEKGYDRTNTSLLDSINNYIDDNLLFIRTTLINFDVSGTKNW